ncbi:hypothetical protein [uncultured Roseobacter sp.]|nr:hypothetical protein [uncultured Roseobacter sp.]
MPLEDTKGPLIIGLGLAGPTRKKEQIRLNSGAKFAIYEAAENNTE